MEKAISTISRTLEILDKYDLRPQKKYGQNFLVDPNIVEKIASLSADKDHISLEIGPGIGSLTEMLAKYSKKVIAFEIDDRLIPVLKDDLAHLDNVEIINQDFLNVDLNTLSFKDEIINVAANLPYYVTTPILFKLFESDLKIAKISVMVQKEVADRFKAKVNDEDYNALSVIVNYLYDVHVLTQVPASVFYPRPRVDSTVITFVPKVERDKEFEKKFFKLVKLSFTQRRKTLYNNLRTEYSSELVEDMLKKLDMKTSIRAQELSLDDFMKIYEVLNA